MGALLINTPCVLIIRDGWGRNPNHEHDDFNAIKLARTPVDDRLMQDCPHTLIRTSGLDVGLPAGMIGNSEVGHQNIGAGRVVDQVSVRISRSCERGELDDVAALTNAIDRARSAGAAVHMLSICSDAGVHGLLDHLYATLELCARRGQQRVAIHLLTDGRDTSPFSGRGYIDQVEKRIAQIGVGRIASLIGRYWAMDRDHRWERVRRAYECLVGAAKCPVFDGAVAAIQDYYDQPESRSLAGDEFVTPRIVGSADQDRIANGDSVIFCNYRGDRPREISEAFVLPDDLWASVEPSPERGVRGFERGKRLDIQFVMMTAYSNALTEFAGVAFPNPRKLDHILGDHLAKCGIEQLRCAETEKFPHVTFFFNDYREEPFDGEHREICPSPEDVATYDARPEMSALHVRDRVLERLDAPDAEPVMIVNFANPDMVGHTGSLEAAIRACEVVDQCVGAIVERTCSRGGSLVVTADHGNAEQMWDPEANAPHTAHTIYDVPLILVGDRWKGHALRDGGRLADIAPTMLAMMGLDRPPEMTGDPLIGTGAATEARSADSSPRMRECRGST